MTDTVTFQGQEHELTKFSPQVQLLVNLGADWSDRLQKAKDDLQIHQANVSVELHQTWNQTLMSLESGLKMIEVALDALHKELSAGITNELRDMESGVLWLGPK